MGIMKEFKEFIVKSNVGDMAVGIIISAAFGMIVKSLVADVIMLPLDFHLAMSISPSCLLFSSTEPKSPSMLLLPMLRRRAR